MSKWRHRNGNTYTKIGTAVCQSGKPVADMEDLILYMGDDGQIWARPPREFFDGRFTQADDSEAARGAAAIRTLAHLGYTYHGGEQWKPPLGLVPQQLTDHLNYTRSHLPNDPPDIARMREFFGRLSKDKVHALNFLKSAGILDENGELAPPYKEE